MTSGSSHSDSQHLSLGQALPFEIWHSISQFIPNNQLERLYPVNHAFFHIAMPLRYHTISLSGPDDLLGNSFSKIHKEILQMPSLAKHVREFVFQVYCYGSAHAIDKSSHRKALATFTSCLRLSRERRIRKLKTRVYKIKAFMVLLDRLTNLTIEWHCPHTEKLFFGLYVDILTVGWSAVDSTIQNLSLSFVPQAIPFLFASPFHLPQLVNLDLCVQYNSSTELDNPLIYSTMAPILQSHSNTIKTLSVQFSPFVNHPNFYTTFPHLPELQTFKIREMYSDQNDHKPALSSFLHLHSASLIEIDWALSSGPGWPTVLTHDTFTLAPFDVHLPKLQKLRISFSVFWMKLLRDFRDVVTYIGRHSRTLQSLTIFGRSLSELDLYGILHGPTLSQLHTLDIALDHLGVHAFATLAIRLPNLQTLKIAFRQLDTTPIQLPAEILINWRMSALTLQQLDWSEETKSISESMGRSILAIMPNVQYLNAIPRDVTLSPTNNEDSDIAAVDNGGVT